VADLAPRVVLRPLAPADADELMRIHATPEVRRWWDAPDPGFPLTDDPESTRLTIEVNGAVAGMIQFAEELEPKYRHAGIDLFLDPAWHGRGVGTEAVRRVVRHLIAERGHHRITIDPAVANAAAIRSYEKAGFRRVGVMRRYERDADGRGWHDGLLMELLAGEERSATLTGMRLGQIGVWRRHQEGTDVVPEIEALGYSALWVGGSPSLAQVRPFLERSERLLIATGILNVWQHEPADVAAQHAELTREFPGRFLLGIGIGHPEATSDYTRPLTTMREFFDGLDAAPEPVPRDERIAAALGPKMLELAAERSLGAHPYFTTADHTRFARDIVGPDAVLAPELAVVLEPDAERGRALAREYAASYLRLSNYTSNLLRFGFTERDLEDGGSDRLIDAVIPHGPVEAIVEGVRAHLDAGADHVCLQPLGHGAAPLDDYRALARALL
jgi:probable F420-dependent oxidoreductase